jgi:hypothetical protein
MSILNVNEEDLEITLIDYTKKENCSDIKVYAGKKNLLKHI